MLTRRSLVSAAAGLLMSLVMLAIAPPSQAASTNLSVSVATPGTIPPPSSQNIMTLRFVQVSRVGGDATGGWGGTPNVMVGSGSANSSVGFFNTIQMPTNSAFAGNWTLGGEDAALFSVNPSTGELKIAGADLPTNPSNDCSRTRGFACFTLMVTATQSGVYNSPFTDEFVFYGWNSASPPAGVGLNKTLANPGDIVTATVTGASNTNGQDCVRLWSMLGNDHDHVRPSANANAGRTWVQQQTVVGNGGSYNFTIPNVPSDWWRVWSVQYARDCRGSAAISSYIYVPPTGPPLVSTASVAFDQPFTPDHTMSVCPSGCDYTMPSAAYNAALGNHFDNVKIDIHAGIYPDCVVVRSGSNGIGRIWFRGYGGGFAYMRCPQGSSFGVVNDGGATSAGLPMVVVENMEFGDNGGIGLANFPPFNLMTFWLRNVYVHDVSPGTAVFTNVGAGGCVSNNPHRAPTDCEPRNTYTLKVENSRISRAGSGNGPQHNMYIEGPDEFDFWYSISESNLVGHALKSRSWLTDINCSKFMASYNPDSRSTGLFAGGSVIDFSEGWRARLKNSVLAWGASIGNDTIMKWGKDQESGGGSNVTVSDYSYEASNNVWINEGGGYPNDMGSDLWAPYWDPWLMQLPPSSSKDETFIGFGHWGQFKLGESPYYFSNKNNKGLLQPRQNSTQYNASIPNGTAMTVASAKPGLIFYPIQSGVTAATEPPEYATAVDNGTPGIEVSKGTVITDGTAKFLTIHENPFFPITGTKSFDSRTDAGIPDLAGYVGYGDDPARFPARAECGSRPIGNVAIP